MFLIFSVLSSYLLFYGTSHGAVLEIKRDFSSIIDKNSQNFIGLNNNNYLNNNLIFNQGGSSAFIYNQGVVKIGNNSLVNKDLKQISTQELKRKKRFYTVLKGDSVFSIAKKFNISQNTIIWENNIKNNKLRIGQELIILPTSGISYKIKKGDTISSIAKKYKIDIAKIKEYNNISEKGLQIGEELFLAGAKKEITKKTITKKKNNKKTVTKKQNGKIYTAGNGVLIKSKRIVPFNQGVKINVPKRVPGRYKYTRTDYGYFTHPAPGSIRTQGIHPGNAIDMAGKWGSNIYAAADGKVIKASSGGWGGGYGTYLIIKHPNGIQTLYAHNSRLLVSVGEQVKKGQVIAKMGSSGRSTGTHVHFEVRGAYNPF